MTNVISRDDGGRFSERVIAPDLQGLTGANEAQAFLESSHNISKHGFGFFLGEGCATAFPSLLFMGKLPFR